MRTKTTPVVGGLAAAALSIAAISAGGIEAASDTAPTDTTEAAATTPEGTGAGGEFPPLRVAVVLPSTAQEFGISRGIVRAMDILQEERGGEENFELAYSENMFVVDDAASAIRDYASRGFDVIIAASSAYGSSIEEIAPEFPDVSIIWGTNPETFDLPNVFAFSARSEQGGYVGGLVAGMLGDTVGFVGPIYVGSIAGSVDGFKAGVTAANEDANVLENFTNSFSDASLAGAAAATMVQSGATVLASQTEMGAGVASVAENSDGQVGYVGFDADWQPAAPNATILSLDFHYEVALREALLEVDNGVLGGEVFWIDIPNGGITPVWNENYDVPDDVRAAADEAVELITSGDLDVTSLIESE